MSIIKLIDKTNDSRHLSPEDALEWARERMGAEGGGAFKSGKKLLILALDQGEDKSDYNISFVQAGMSMAECIALCEVAKVEFLKNMGYIDDGTEHF